MSQANSTHDRVAARDTIRNVIKSAPNKRRPFAIATLGGFYVTAVAEHGGPGSGPSLLRKMRFKADNMPKGCKGENVSIKAFGLLHRDQQKRIVLEIDKAIPGDAFRHLKNDFFPHLKARSPFKVIVIRRLKAGDEGDTFTDAPDDTPPTDSEVEELLSLNGDEIELINEFQEAGEASEGEVADALPVLGEIKAESSSGESADDAPGAGRPALPSSDAVPMLFRNTLQLTVSSLTVDILRAAGEPRPTAGMSGYEKIIHDKLKAEMGDGSSFSEALSRFDTLVRPRLKDRGFARGLLRLPRESRNAAKCRTLNDRWTAAPQNAYFAAVAFEDEAETLLSAAFMPSVEDGGGSWDQVTALSDAIAGWGAGTSSLFQRLGEATAPGNAVIAAELQTALEGQLSFLKSHAEVAREIDEPKLSIPSGTVTAFRTEVQNILAELGTAA